MIFCNPPDAICIWILDFADLARRENLARAILRGAVLGIVDLVHTVVALGIKVRMKLGPVVLRPGGGDWYGALYSRASIAVSSVIYGEKGGKKLRKWRPHHWQAGAGDCHVFFGYGP
jgi:hypothetical protein